MMGRRLSLHHNVNIPALSHTTREGWGTLGCLVIVHSLAEPGRVLRPGEATR
jgi:hypothetical protein